MVSKAEEALKKADRVLQKAEQELKKANACLVKDHPKLLTEFEATDEDAEDDLRELMRSDRVLQWLKWAKFIETCAKNALQGEAKRKFLSKLE